MKVVCILLSIIAVCMAEVTSPDVTLENYAIKVGGSATIPCTHSAAADGVKVSISWYARINGVQQRLMIDGVMDAGYTRREIAMTEEGSLSIPNTTLEDNADLKELTCEVDFTMGDDAASGEGTLMFTVVALPTANPVTDLSDQEFNLSELKVTVGTCESDFGYPVPEIMFFKGSEPLVSNEENGDSEIEENEDDEFSAFTNDKVTTENDAKTMSKVKKSLLIPITVSDDEAQYYCVVTGGADDITSNQKVAFPTFRVIYPTTNVEVVPQQTDLYDGDVVTFDCNTNGYPTPSVEDFYGSSSNSVEITMTKALTGTQVECEVEYTGASSSIVGNYTINVLYADMPTVSGAESVAMGTKLSLDCSSMSNPAPVSVMWMKGSTVVSESGMLDIESTEFSDGGEYTCKAENQYDQLTKSVTVMVDITGLDVDTTDDEVAGVIGDSVTLVCSAKASTQPTFSWMKTGSDEAIFGADTSNAGQNEYSNTLTVGPLDETMSEAEYVCNVSLGDESESKSFKLPQILENSTPTIEDLQAAGGGSTATIIIIILVLLLLVAIVLAVLYNKGYICNKGEKGDENAEDIEVEIPKDNDDDIETGKPPKEAVNEETGLMNGNDE